MEANVGDLSYIMGVNKVIAPGPDGIPYSCWARGPPAIKRALYELVLHTIAGGKLSEEFNWAIMVFIQKKKKEGDRVSVVCLCKCAFVCRSKRARERESESERVSGRGYTWGEHYINFGLRQYPIHVLQCIHICVCVRFCV